MLSSCLAWLRREAPNFPGTLSRLATNLFLGKLRPNGPYNVVQRLIQRLSAMFFFARAVGKVCPGIVHHTAAAMA